MLVTVFGGTGFLGRRVVRHLQDADFIVRIASRHPERGLSPVANDGSNIESVQADINDDGSILAATRGAYAVVNAVSLYVERGKDTFRSVHVEAAARVAELARQSGVARIAHLSGIGSDPRSTSSYIRCRGEGEEAVRQAFPGATMIRPAVMFGPEDAFVTPLLKMLRVLPIFPMFGRGQTRLQPAYVDDVAKAIARALRSPDAASAYDLAGPRIYTYEELLATIAAGVGKRPLLLPFPFALWRAVGYASKILPNVPITTSQIELMQIDNIASPNAPGFDALGVSPRAIEEVLPQILKQATADASASPLPGPDPPESEQIVGPLSEEGFRTLFDGTAATFSQWRLSGPTGGGMRHANGEMLSYGDGGLRLFYYATETFADFTLRLQFKILDAAKHNSGVFVRFADPTFDLPPSLSQRVGNEPSFDPNNPAWRPVISGFEVQIDDNAIGDSTKDFHGIRPEPDGLYKNRTGAIYKIQAGDRIWHQDRNEPAMQTYTPGPPLVPDVWFEYEIVVQGDDYAVFLSNTRSGERRQTTTFHNTDGDRGRAPGFIGVQVYPGSAVAWRHIRIKT